MRNLDTTTLRSFVAVAENGGVTRAAGFLHLTQSAVSMQIKRLEDLLGVALFDRAGRGLALTASGEQLLLYARRMISLNDEAVSRLTDHAYQGEITLGVPLDIVHPWIPQVLRQFYTSFPRVKVRLETSYTQSLLEQFARGNLDLILTTETKENDDAELLTTKPLLWCGAQTGASWRQRPIKLAFCKKCSFRAVSLQQLDHANLPWEMVVDTDSDRTVEATVSADLAISAYISGTCPTGICRIEDGNVLPSLPDQKINLYSSPTSGDEALIALTSLLRNAFSGHA